MSSRQAHTIIIGTNFADESARTLKKSSRSAPRAGSSSGSELGSPSWAPAKSGGGKKITALFHKLSKNYMPCSTFTNIKKKSRKSTGGVHLPCCRCCPWWSRTLPPGEHRFLHTCCRINKKNGMNKQIKKNPESQSTWIFILTRRSACRLCQAAEAFVFQCNCRRDTGQWCRP